MSRPTLIGFGEADDGKPAFLYETSFEQVGHELRGKFNVQLAAARDNETGELVFAVVDGRGLLDTFEYDEPVADLLDSILEHGGFYSFINYEGKTIEYPEGVGYTPLGRDFGEQTDHREWHALSDGDLASVRHIKETLDDA